MTAELQTSPSNSKRLEMEDDVLFVGLGQSAVGWYRCYLPALFLGADWAGIVGEPGRWAMTTGLVERQTKMPDFANYEVVVLQQPFGGKWLTLIREMQDMGIKVLFEVDDYLHSIRKQDDHDFQDHFDKAHLKRLELCMRVCDGLIVSTEFIARKYRAFNRRVFVCENGLDTARYRLTRPPRPTVNIGWAGATAHADAMAPWLQAVAQVMAERPNTCFVTIGQDFAATLKPEFGNRCISTPFTLIETYPSAMTMFDIALAPAGRKNFHKGKSDLRFLEAGALGVPCIADPSTYPYIVDGETGFWAETPDLAFEVILDLVDDEELRTSVGASAQRYVREQRDMSIACEQWRAVFEEVVE